LALIPDANLVCKYLPNYNGGKRVTLKVPSSKLNYTISLGENLPVFTFISENGLEIFRRLILRSALVNNNINELEIRKTK